MKATDDIPHNAKDVKIFFDFLCKRIPSSHQMRTSTHFQVIPENLNLNDLTGEELTKMMKTLYIYFC